MPVKRNLAVDDFGGGDLLAQAHSWIGWIDFDEDDRKLVEEAMRNAFKTDLTRDSLGIAPLMDAYSNRLFPSVTTQHTLVRYLLVIPYLVEDLRNNLRNTGINEVSPQELQETFSELERRWTKSVMETSSDWLGLVGSQAIESDAWVKLPPSIMNWSAIRNVGILRDGNEEYTDISFRQFMSTLIESSDPTASDYGKHGNKNDDDDGEIDTGQESRGLVLWTQQGGKFKKLYEEWSSSNSKKYQKYPTRDEAEYIEEQINANCRGSLYKFLLDDEHYWKLPDTVRNRSGQPDKDETQFSHFMSEWGNASLPEGGSGEYGDLASTCSAANRLSNFVYLLRIQLNYALGEHFKDAELQENADEAWGELESTSELEAYVREFDVDDAYEYSGRSQGGDGRLREFLDETKRHLDKYIAAANDDERDEHLKNLRGCIEKRERYRKKLKSLFSRQDPPDGWVDGYRLDYRFRYGFSHVRELREALAEGDANA